MPRVRERASGALEDSRELRRDAVDETRETGRDAARDVRDLDRDASSDGRVGFSDRPDADRGTLSDSRLSADVDFRAEDIRAADLGLWFSRAGRDGLVIADVAGSGAIAQFGFREGDRILSVNGRRVMTEDDFIGSLFADDFVRARVPVVVLRGGRQRLVYVRPEVFVSQFQTPTVDPLDRFGVVLDDRYADRIVVWRVLPRSAAFYAGLRPGDVITSFDGQRVLDAGDFVRLIERADPVDVAIQVSRNQQVRDLDIDLSIAEAGDRRTSLRPSVEERPMRMDRTFDDIRSVDPSSDRRLSPRPDVPPGMRVPGGEVGRDRGPIAPSGAEGGTPTTPMRLGFPR